MRAEKAPLRPMPRAAVTVDAGGDVDAGTAAAGEPHGAAGVACHLYYLSWWTHGGVLMLEKRLRGSPKTPLA